MKVKILTHNSGEYETTVESFDPVDLNLKLNSNDINTVLIGELIFSRIDVKVVTPIEDNTETQEGSN